MDFLGISDTVCYYRFIKRAKQYLEDEFKELEQQVTLHKRKASRIDEVVFKNDMREALSARLELLGLSRQQRFVLTNRFVTEEAMDALATIINNDWDQIKPYQKREQITQQELDKKLKHVSNRLHMLPEAHSEQTNTVNFLQRKNIHLRKLLTDVKRRMEIMKEKKLILQDKGKFIAKENNLISSEIKTLQTKRIELYKSSNQKMLHLKNEIKNMDRIYNQVLHKIPEFQAAKINHVGSTYNPRSITFMVQMLLESQISKYSEAICAIKCLRYERLYYHRNERKFERHKNRRWLEYHKNKLICTEALDNLDTENEKESNIQVEVLTDCIQPGYRDLDTNFQVLMELTSAIQNTTVQRLYQLSNGTLFKNSSLLRYTQKIKMELEAIVMSLQNVQDAVRKFYSDPVSHVDLLNN